MGIDFWGRFRRAVTAADDLLGSFLRDYDGVLVTLLGDVASYYVRVRTDKERIALLRADVELQQGVLNFIELQYKAGYRQTKLDLDQAVSNLKQDEAAIPQLEIDQRQAEIPLHLAGHADGRPDESTRPRADSRCSSGDCVGHSR